MTYALFKDSKQISKAHSTREAAIVEAREIGKVQRVVHDFCGNTHRITLVEGYEIREVTP